MALIILNDSRFDDGNVYFIPSNPCKRDENALTEEDVKRMIAESDKYVREGELDKDGKLVLKVSDSDNATIDLSELKTEPLTTQEVEDALSE